MASPVVSIPPLSHILAPDYAGIVLCLVRVLRILRRWTRGTCGQLIHRLLVAVKPNFPWDFSLQSVSCWVKAAVGHAYTLQSIDTTIRTH